MKLLAAIPSIFFLIILCALTSHEQEIHFNIVEGNNGEPLGQINSITQDPHGYLWFSGQGAGCIYRYDGVRMIAFRHDSLNENSLGETNPEIVYADPKGIIWIGFFLTEGGMDSYNPVTGLFKHYRNNPKDSNSISAGVVSAILRDHLGRLWVGTENGLDQLDEKTGKFIHYRHIPGNSSSLSCNFVRAIYEDREGVLWIGTGFEFAPDIKLNQDGGLNRMEPNGTFTRFLHDPNNPQSLINNKVRAIFEDSRGIFWIGTAGDGLHTMDRKTGRFERHTFDQSHPDKLSRPPLKRDGLFEPLTFIKEDADGFIWIGTYISGVNRYDPATKKITHYESSHGYPDKNCWTAFKSSDGVLWLSSTDQGGFLFRVVPTIKQLHNFITPSPVISLYEDKQQRLWVYNQLEGLFEYDKNKKLLRQYKEDPTDSIKLSDVISFFQYNADSLWLCTTTGLILFNKKTNHFTWLRYKPALDSTPQKFIGDVVLQVAKDRDGNVWMATFHGLCQFNSKISVIKRYLYDEKDTTTIRSNNITSVLEDHEGNIWASAGDWQNVFELVKLPDKKEYGIDRLNKKTGKFTHYLNGINILRLTMDATGTIWAGSSGHGLYMFNKKADRFEMFVGSGIEFNQEPIVNILEDDLHNLWVVTISSIVRINTDRKTYFIYGKQYGIRSNTLRLPAICKTSAGEVLVGNNNGFYILSPNEMQDTSKPLQLNVTGFLINNHPVSFGNGSVLEQPVEDTKKIALRYDQNNLTFNFAAVDYRAPEANKYYTLLENFDNLWRDAGGDKSANYINLPPGQYTFHVRAINVDGVKAEKTIQIMISPPWWKTTWAYLLYALFLLTGAWFLHKFQQQRTINRERQRAQIKELAQAKEIERAYNQLKATQAQLIQSEKMASLGELTAGIAHEIQNPLNFINNFSEVNKELVAELQQETDKGNISEIKALANDIEENEQKIAFHGKRADAIVKSMLEHSRTSKGEKQPTNLNALTDEYLRLAYHGFRAKDKNFNAAIQTQFDESIDNVNIVPQDIGRVLLNLFNNAFYAVGEKKKQAAEGYGPTVSVSIKRQQDKIEIIVQDNGTGIPQNVVDKIFQPFFTTKPTGQGTGLGLSLSYDIVKAHGGELKVESTEGEGATFSMELPVS